MKIKIDSVNGVNLATQCLIVADYIRLEGNALGPVETKKGTGTKIESCGRMYHVSCNKTKTMWNFKIWYGM